jgi:hypothetical protein
MPGKPDHLESARAQPQGARVGSDLGFEDEATLQLPRGEARNAASEAGDALAQLGEEPLPDQALVRAAGSSPMQGLQPGPVPVPLHSHCPVWASEEAPTSAGRKDPSSSCFIWLLQADVAAVEQDFLAEQEPGVPKQVKAGAGKQAMAKEALSGAAAAAAAEDDAAEEEEDAEQAALEDAEYADEGDEGAAAGEQEGQEEEDGYLAEDEAAGAEGSEPDQDEDEEPF